MLVDVLAHIAFRVEHGVGTQQFAVEDIGADLAVEGVNLVEVHPDVSVGHLLDNLFVALLLGVQLFEQLLITTLGNLVLFFQPFYLLTATLQLGIEVAADAPFHSLEVCCLLGFVLKHQHQRVLGVLILTVQYVWV